MSAANGQHTIAVTGAAGFLGSHAIREFLAAGHTVRATVRDASDERRTAHLSSLPGAERLKIFSADLLDSASFDEPFAGCDWICHAAAVARLVAKDPEREIVRPSVEGTRNVLAAAERAGTVERMVMTSSVAAVGGASGPAGVTLTEEDWNEEASLRTSPYPYAKLRAEQEAWTFVDSLPEHSRFRLVTLLPSFVQGPILAKVHLRTSPAIIRQLLRGKMPMVPRLSFTIVDVRDVAIAHLRALTRDDAEGRYLLGAGPMWLQEIAHILKDEFPQAKVPTHRAPNLLIYASSLFNQQLSWRYLRNNLDIERYFDNAKAKRGLGIEFRPLRETIADTGHAIYTIAG